MPNSEQYLTKSGHHELFTNSCTP